MKSANEFTMSSGGFNWMATDTNDDIDIATMGIENYVRWMARQYIEANAYQYKASPETIYRVWRKSGEFQEAIEAIKKIIK